MRKPLLRALGGVMLGVAAAVVLALLLGAGEPQAETCADLQQALDGYRACAAHPGCEMEEWDASRLERMEKRAMKVCKQSDRKLEVIHD